MKKSAVLTVVGAALTACTLPEAGTSFSVAGEIPEITLGEEVINPADDSGASYGGALQSDDASGTTEPEEESICTLATDRNDSAYSAAAGLNGRAVADEEDIVVENGEVVLIRNYTHWEPEPDIEAIKDYAQAKGGLE